MSPTSSANGTFFCGVRLGVGGELLGVSGWEGMGD